MKRSATPNELGAARWRRWLAAGVGIAGLWLPSACGRCPPSTPVTWSDRAEPAATSEAAARMFAAAETDLRVALGIGAVEPRTEQIDPAGDQTPAAQLSRRGSSAAPPPSQHGAHGHRRSGDGCTRACRALASMRRSAARLCQLDGFGSERCQNVQRRVASARRLVLSICPACRQ